MEIPEPASGGDLFGDPQEGLFEGGRPHVQSAQLHPGLGGPAQQSGGGAPEFMGLQLDHPVVDLVAADVQFGERWEVADEAAIGELEGEGSWKEIRTGWVAVTSAGSR